MTSHDDNVITRRQYLSMTALLGGTPARLLRETVATNARQHPEWDMNELHTHAYWERMMPKATDTGTDHSCLAEAGPG